MVSQRQARRLPRMARARAEARCRCCRRWAAAAAAAAAAAQAADPRGCSPVHIVALSRIPLRVYRCDRGSCRFLAAAARIGTARELTVTRRTAAQKHITRQGCGQAGGQGAAGGDRRQGDQPRRQRRRQAAARPDSDVSAALAGVQGDAPRRQRKTARDWDAEMAEALAGRAARRGGGGGAAAAGASGGAAAAVAAGAGQRTLLDVSDGESSDDEDWQPGAAGAQSSRGRSAEEANSGDDDVSVSGKLTAFLAACGQTPALLHLLLQQHCWPRCCKLHLPHGMLPWLARRG